MSDVIPCLVVACRKCSARPGERCVSVDRKRNPTPRYVRPHAARRHDFEEGYAA